MHPAAGGRDPRDMKAFKDEYQSELAASSTPIAGEESGRHRRGDASKVVDLLAAVRRSLAKKAAPKRKAGQPRRSEGGRDRGGALGDPPTGSTRSS
jgi:non-homologous end joining protein Ku